MQSYGHERKLFKMSRQSHLEKTINLH